MSSEHKFNAIGRAGAVIIGRNEGERLRGCLRSVLAQVPREAVVYVDSGSIDNSVDLARQMGVDVLKLDPARPFSAARGRNEGFDRLTKRDASLEFIQFIDGDCEMLDGWMLCARNAMEQCERAGVVFGTLREREPQRSIYNRLCALEWKREPGDVAWCGGIFMARASTFASVGGLRTSMVAGEEPEFCTRLRTAGWTIKCVEDEMATHDAAIVRFSQWWRRSARAGHAWAERAALHAFSGDAAALKQVVSILVWGVFLPVAAVAFAWGTSGWSLVALAAYPLQWLRVTFAQRRRGFTMGDAAIYSLFTIVDKFAGVEGIARFVWNRALSRPTKLIEHKQPSVQCSE